MLLSLGGLGLWTILDLLRIIFGQFRDEDGLKVKIWAKENSGLKILISLVLVLGLSYFTHTLNLFDTQSLKSFSFLTNSIKKPLKEKKGTTIRKDKSDKIIKYIDDKGITHFVNEEDKIPSRYRKNADTNLELPPLNVEK